MPEKVAKITKPSTDDFKKERKLFFVPLVFKEMDSPGDYLEKLGQYWKQVEKQIKELELKLGSIQKIYHELAAAGDKEGLEAIKDLNEESYKIIKKKIEEGGQLQATEDSDTLTAFMDWSRCLAIGLQNQKVLSTIYQSYIEAGRKRNESIAKRLDETLKPDESLQNQKVLSTIYQSYIEAGRKRNESIAKRLDETLKPDETGILFMREGHQVQFPTDIQVFYVVPPALDEVKRWLRDHEFQKMKKSETEQKDKEENK